MKSEVEIKEKLAYWHGLAEELRIRLPELPPKWFGNPEFSEFIHLVHYQTMAEALNWVLAED